MNWLGLNWTDFLLNVFLLAVVPGFLGALGGHLAAEGLQDKRRAYRIKEIFWGMFVVWVAATVWQQFRSAQSDLAKDTRREWADAELLHSFVPNTTPPLFSYEKNYSKRVSIPDVALRFVYPHSISMLIENVSDDVVRDVRYVPVIWNLDSGTDSPMPLPIQSFNDFIKPKNFMGPYSMNTAYNNPTIPLAKKGDRLLGFASITCAKCPRTRAYWIYAVQGDSSSSWYYELPKGSYPNTTYTARNLEQIRKNPEVLFSNINIRDRKRFADVPED